MLTALLALSTTTHAAWITLEPDEVEAGTNVSNYWDGVSLRAVHYQNGGIYTFAPIISDTVDNGRVPTGSQAFRSVLDDDTWSWGNIGGASCVFTLRQCGPWSWNVMLLQFDEAVGDVSVLTNFGSDGLGVWLFDANYNLVGSCNQTFGYMSNPCYENMGATGTYGVNWQIAASSETRDVRYAVIGGLAVGGTVDAISYSVPEPGTLALLGVGLLGLAVRRRRVQDSAQAR